MKFWEICLGGMWSKRIAEHVACTRNWPRTTTNFVEFSLKSSLKLWLSRPRFSTAPFPKKNVAQILNILILWWLHWCFYVISSFVAATCAFSNLYVRLSQHGPPSGKLRPKMCSDDPPSKHFSHPNDTQTTTFRQHKRQTTSSHQDETQSMSSRQHKTATKSSPQYKTQALP